MRTVDQSIHRIRAFAAAKGWKKGRLASEAGLNDTTLRAFHDPDWNPTADTLRQLEAIIPQTFDPDRPETANDEQAGSSSIPSPPLKAAS
jgi:ribosome-binding protein aMBF1 (putative translation factor)